MTASEYIAIELMRLDGKIKAIKENPGWKDSQTLRRVVRMFDGEIDGLLRAKMALK